MIFVSRIFLILFLCIAFTRIQATELICPDTLQPGSLHVELQPQGTIFDLNIDSINVFRSININIFRGVRYSIFFRWGNGLNHVIRVVVKNPRENQVSHQILIERLLDALSGMPEGLLKDIRSIMVYNYDNSSNKEYYTKKINSDIVVSCESGLYAFSYNPTIFKEYLFDLLKEYSERVISI